MFKLLFRLIKFIIKMIVFFAVVGICINFFVIKVMEKDITASYTGSAASITNVDLVEMSRIEPECIMVLGAAVNPDGSPSPALEDRLKTGVSLYYRGVAPKILLTGDNGQMEYNEVEAMKNYVLSAGVPEEDVVLDHAGFSTYDSVYRASYVYGVESMVVVTQEYHLYRALYGCKKMDIEALGVSASQKTYEGQELQEIREVLARVKDFVKWQIKPEATFLGEAVPIN